MANSQNIAIDLGITNNRVIANLTKVQQEFTYTQTIVNNLNQNINNTYIALNHLEKAKPTPLADQISKIGKEFGALSAPGMAFEQMLADLSAQTGITGKHLEVLSGQARNTGISSGMGAAEAIKAYQALSSQVELSGIGLNGLNALQEKTMTLAKASGLEVEGAASALTTTLSQFGLEVSQADRVMNVLAAGAKYGASGIPELSKALSVTGDAARATGISVETTAGALEVLSRNNLKGAEAGRSLSDMMLKMQNSLGIDLSSVPFSAALDQLKPKLNDAAYLSQLFGEKNVATAQI